MSWHISLWSSQHPHSHQNKTNHIPGCRNQNKSHNQNHNDYNHTYHSHNYRRPWYRKDRNRTDENPWLSCLPKICEDLLLLLSICLAVWQAWRCIDKYLAEPTAYRLLWFLCWFLAILENWLSGQYCQTLAFGIDPLYQWHWHWHWSIVSMTLALAPVHCTNI